MHDKVPAQPFFIERTVSVLPSQQPTIRENIERQIKFHEERAAKLRETLDKMHKTGLLDMRIDEIREAMNY